MLPVLLWAIFFKYGRGNGLYEIQRTADADQQIITRLRAYGSTRNMPNRIIMALKRFSLPNYLPNNMAGKKSCYLIFQDNA